jgi:hypothetical protein
LRGADIVCVSENEYSKMILGLQPLYQALDVSESGATVVANSKALHHLLPRLVPPVDRQYTLRFFRQSISVLQLRQMNALATRWPM